MNPLSIALIAFIATLIAQGHVPPGLSPMDVILPTGIG
ncbi:MAG: hypothetical protein JWM87_2817 [Candidatus Eremiobacteraeota bacterium]|nr:hypothetical protein [Candidatus Eremiobacteraeota bacterium]